MAVYILPGNVVLDSSKMPYQDYLDVKRHKKSIYDFIVKDKKEIKRLLSRPKKKEKVNV